MPQIFLRLTVTALLCLSGLSCSDSSVPPSTSTTPVIPSEVLTRFPESTWLNTDEDILNHLSFQPVECINTEAYSSNTYQIDAGKAAFNTPALLGGQAARMGISCNTCHRSGQDNPDFFIAGISDSPGRLDVTHGFFSEVREDNNFNPVPIPSLLNIKNKTSFGTVKPTDTLESFIHGVIVDEFDGQEPAPEVMQAVLAYVSALDAQSCDINSQLIHNLETDLDFLTTTIDTLYRAIDRDDSDNISMLVLAAQSLLQNIHARYTNHPDILADIEHMSRDLRAIYRQAREDQRFLLVDWQNRFNTLKTTLIEQEKNSLYRLPQL